MSGGQRTNGRTPGRGERVLHCSKECGHQHFLSSLRKTILLLLIFMQKSKYLDLVFVLTHRWAEVLSYLPQTDIDIGPYAGLLVQLTLGKVLQ